MRACRRVVAIILLSASAFAADQKSVLLGVAIGAGLVGARQYTIMPAARAVKKVTRKPARKLYQVFSGKPPCRSECWKASKQ